MITEQDGHESDRTAAFFARVTASVSHELKNVMATISESAGLLGDLLELTRDVGALDRDELLSCGSTISDEIKRGFRIIRNLNTFAHSADDRYAEMDIDVAVGLVVGLSQYLRRSCPVSFASTSGGGPRIRTNPIRLVELLYVTLAAAFQKIGPDGNLTITTRTTNSGALLRIDGLDDDAARRAAGTEVMELAEILNATINCESAGLSIRFSADLDSAG